MSASIHYLQAERDRRAAEAAEIAELELAAAAELERQARAFGTVLALGLIVYILIRPEPL